MSFYLVVPRRDDQLLLVFSQFGLLTLTLQRKFDERELLLGVGGGLTQ